MKNMLNEFNELFLCGDAKMKNNFDCNVAKQSLMKTKNLIIIILICFSFHYDTTNVNFAFFVFQSVGNLAFQDFHQRTLSSSSTSTARTICFIAAGVVIVLGIPPVLIGATAASTGTH